MKHLFIVNPTAGGQDKTAAITAEVERVFAGRSEDFEVYTTKAPLDACKKIEYEAEMYEDLRVYACGGDGTLNECVSASVGRKNVSVTCYPTGTGNDFIKTFGEEKKLFHDLDALVNGEVHQIDVIECNDRYSINICSVGIDARIGTDVHKYSALPLIGGATGYVTSTVVNFFKGIRDDLRVICDGKLYYGDMSLICCCNGTHYGGGFNPVPEARIDDGEMTCLLVKGISRLAFVKLVSAYAKGQYLRLPEYITPLHTTALEIESEKELTFQLDGEILTAKKVKLRLLPGMLNFIAPAGMAYFAKKACECCEH